MNKYDDIKTLLLTNMDVSQSCEFLYNYLKNYCFKPYNREKIDSYYNNLAEILKRFLYFPNEKNLNAQNQKIFQSLLQIVNTKNSNFQDFDILLNLFLVPINFENEVNLFSSIFIHNYGNTKFLFPIVNSSNTNKMILQYLSQNGNEVILNNFGIFQILSQSKEDIIKYLNRKELILTIREYYIFTILSFIRKSSIFNKLNIKDYYPNFKRFLENITESKYFSKKTEFIMNNFEKDRSINYNFYNILFLDFILFLHFTPYVTSQRLLEILTFAIEFLWLGDFLLLPANYFYSMSNINKIESYTNPQNIGISTANSYNNFFFSNKNVEFQNLLGLNAGVFTNQNMITKQIHLTIPNLLLLNCMKNFISLLQSRKYLFDESTFNGGKILLLKPNVLLFNLQNSLFNLFKFGFTKFYNHEITSEISLSDFASVWYTFLTPWESPFNETYSSITNSNSTSPSGKSFGFLNWYGSENHSDSKNMNSAFYNNFNCRKNVSPLKTIFGAHSLHNKHKAQIGMYRGYIEINLHFYTSLFQEYINAFSVWNILSVEELSILINLLEMYEINQGLFINNFINYFMLKDFSNGNIINFSHSGVIENFVRHNAYIRKDLFPFDIEENINQVKLLISSLANLIFKLSNSNDYRLEDTSRFIKRIEHSITILKNLYVIKEDDIEYSKALSTPIRDSSNVYDKRIILESLEFDNPWNKKITSEESSILFFILFYIACFIDYLRSIPKQFNKEGVPLPPITNLRYFCNYYNVLSTFAMLICLYFMLKLIILYLY